MRIIILTKRTHDWHAQVEGAAQWGAGDTIEEACGSLLRAHADMFVGGLLYEI